MSESRISEFGNQCYSLILYSSILVSTYLEEQYE